MCHNQDVNWEPMQEINVGYIWGKLYNVIQRTLIVTSGDLVLAVMLIVDFNALIPIPFNPFSWIK